MLEQDPYVSLRKSFQGTYIDALRCLSRWHLINTGYKLWYICTYKKACIKQHFVQQSLAVSVVLVPKALCYFNKTKYTGRCSYVSVRYDGNDG